MKKTNKRWNARDQGSARIIPQLSAVTLVEGTSLSLKRNTKPRRVTRTCLGPKMRWEGGAGGQGVVGLWRMPCRSSGRDRMTASMCALSLANVPGRTGRCSFSAWVWSRNRNHGSTLSMLISPSSLFRLICLMLPLLCHSVDGRQSTKQPHLEHERPLVHTDQFVLELQDQVHHLHLRMLLDSLLQVLQTDTDQWDLQSKTTQPKTQPPPRVLQCEASLLPHTRPPDEEPPVSGSSLSSWCGTSHQSWEIWGNAFGARKPHVTPSLCYLDALVTLS